jgi:hypothetical protein
MLSAVLGFVIECSCLSAELDMLLPCFAGCCRPNCAALLVSSSLAERCALFVAA